MNDARAHRIAVGINLDTDPPTRRLAFTKDRVGFGSIRKTLDAFAVELVAALLDAGFAVAVVNGARICKFANASGTFAKTNAIDDKEP
ncbi:MAG: hypothetical protein U0572_00165 [Phycisphaerales bacterium]